MQRDALIMWSITLPGVSTLQNSENMDMRAKNRPTMCRSCGAIVGAGASECAVCGTPVSNVVSQPRPVIADRETLRFARAILNRPYKFTIALIIVNFFIFLLMWQSSGLTARALWEFPDGVLQAYGAKLNFLIRQQHQWWRFITPMFVHVNLPHVLVNMYSLWIVGPYVEKLYGSAKFTVFWVLTGIAGVAASYFTVVGPATHVGALGRFILKTQDVPSAGASGALFGLVGVLFVFGIKFRRELPEGFKRAFGTGMLPIIFLNLFIGYLGRGFIDNAAHLGGLLSGAALALVVQYRRPGERASITVSWYALQAAAIVLVAVSFLEIVRHFSTATLPTTSSEKAAISSSASDKAALFLAYAKALNDAQEKLNEALAGDNSGVDQALTDLDSAPSVDPKADDLRNQLKLLLLKTKTAGAASPSPSRRAGGGPKVMDVADEFAAWKTEYNQWLKTTGKNYGGSL
jgi:membrane associated rhomboid family serine protease